MSFQASIGLAPSRAGSSATPFSHCAFSLGKRRYPSSAVRGAGTGNDCSGRSLPGQTRRFRSAEICGSSSRRTPRGRHHGAKRTHSDMPPANRLRPSRRNDDLQFFTLNFLHRHRVLRPEEGGPIRQGRSSDSFPLHAFPPRRGSGSKSAQSMTELTATGIVPDSHRRSLLIPGRQPPAENLARNKSRKYPAGGPTTAPVLINNLSTKRRNPGATHAAGGNGHRPPQRETPEPLRGKDSSRHERKHTPP